MTVPQWITDTAHQCTQDDQQHHDDWLHQYLDTIAQNTRLQMENDRLRDTLDHIQAISQRAIEEDSPIRSERQAH